MVTRRADGYRNSPTPTTRSCHASLSYEGKIRSSSTTIIWEVGSWNRVSHASFGGSCSRVNEDGKDETVRQCKTSDIGVIRVGDQPVCVIVSLKDISEEMQRKADLKVPTQERVC